MREARVSRILGIVLDIVHALYEKLLGNAETLAEFGGVESSALFVHHHHDVVSGLVVHEELALTVGYYAARGIFYFFEEGVTVGIFLVVVAHELQHEQANDIDNDDGNGHATDDIPAFFEIEVAHFRFLRFSITRIRSSVSTVHPPTLAAHCMML